jgi:hypothetical protein
MSVRYRIFETVRNIRCIYTDLVTQQMVTDKIRGIKDYIYVHLWVSIDLATIVMVFYKNIDK